MCFHFALVFSKLFTSIYIEKKSLFHLKFIVYIYSCQFCLYCCFCRWCCWCWLLFCIQSHQLTILNYLMNKSHRIASIEIYIRLPACSSTSTWFNLKFNESCIVIRFIAIVNKCNQCKGTRYIDLTMKPNFHTKYVFVLIILELRIRLRLNGIICLLRNETMEMQNKPFSMAIIYNNNNPIR